MSKKIWNSGAIAIIVLPSGDQGLEILDLAQSWSRSWLLTPALWMLADEIPEIDASQNIDLQVPPTLSAYLLGRDSEQRAVREKVDVFWTLGSQPFEKIRFVAVRTEQDLESMRRTSKGAESAARYIERSVPKATDLSRESVTGVLFTKYNLVIAPTNERRLLEGVLSEFWDKNLIAAAEDRATPLSTDSFVKVGERFVGFALAHIATTAGLWTGLPISSAEIDGERTQLRQARLQRVFVRGVTNDALSADVAHWALQKLNYTDTNFEVGLVDGKDVSTISAEVEEFKMNELVNFILEGPEGGEENFLYPEYEIPVFPKDKIKWFRKLLYRIQDIAQGLGSIPSWIKASAEYRIEMALDSEEADEKILLDALPERLAPNVVLPKVDVLKASLKPRLPQPSPALWKHMRESISAAIDAPKIEHPAVLKDLKDDRLLVFATIDRVLPDPDTNWKGENYRGRTSVNFVDIGWLDAQNAHETMRQINKRIEELEPGIQDANNQLSETQKLVDEAKREFQIIKEDLDLIESELNSDIGNAKNVTESHTHQLPKGITGPARKPGKRQKKKDRKKEEDKNFDGKNAVEAEESLSGKAEGGPRTSIWRRFFRRGKEA